MNKLTHTGYGSAFNELFIIDNSIIKQSKTDYGNFKIEKEILFFKYIIENSIPFPVPKIYEFNLHSYTMQFLHKHLPLYKCFPDFSPNKQIDILNHIYSHLHSLHKSSNITLYKDEFSALLFDETNTKIKKRYLEIVPLLSNYTNITHVNGIKILSFETILDIIQTKINEYINTQQDYTLVPIHGDCQFNNILFRHEDNDIVFIDPRGYFGNKELYGIPEYDFAKVKFALSGYDIFDNMEINSLEINDCNVILPTIALIDIDKLFKKNDITSILTISIWLGNAHCFKNNIPKAMFSFYYALYLATQYL
jgi:hypothetical protein